MEELGARDVLDSRTSVSLGFLLEPPAILCANLDLNFFLSETLERGVW